MLKGLPIRKWGMFAVGESGTGSEPELSLSINRNELIYSQKIIL